MGKEAVGRLAHYLGVILTAVVVIITIVASHSSAFHPDQHSFIPFLGLAYPILIWVNLIIMVWWIIRFRFWFIMPLIAIAAGYSYIQALFYPSFLSKGSEEGNFRIATYNAAFFNTPTSDADAKDLAVFMQDENVDVICLQEYGGSYLVSDSLLGAAFAHWPYSYIPQAPEGVKILTPALFSRYPIENTHLVTFEESRNCAIYCDVLVNEKKYRVFNNHLQTTDLTQIKDKSGSGWERKEYYLRLRMKAMQHNFEKRAQQADLISTLVKESPYPVILCGDFNDSPISYTYKTMLGDLEDGFVASGTGSASSYRYAGRMFRIDYLFYSEGLESTRYFSSDFGESDHYPVIMELKL